MDGSFTIKPASVPKFTPRERAPARPVETELDAAKTVTATGDGDGPEQRERPHDHLPHDVVADPEAREVINRENDVRAQPAGREHPDQALLRTRAYRPARSESDNTPPTEPHANIKA